MKRDISPVSGMSKETYRHWRIPASAEIIGFTAGRIVPMTRWKLPLPVLPRLSDWRREQYETSVSFFEVDAHTAEPYRPQGAGVELEGNGSNSSGRRAFI
ncbi:hypothetical protein [Rhizobium sp. LEGMi135b]